MKELIETVDGWDRAGLKSAEAILVGTQHSSPRPTGARLVVNENGDMAGAVSMGCVESDLREHLLAMIREGQPARMVHYGRAFEASWELGLSCGGEIDVWLRRRYADASVPLSAWDGNEKRMVLTELADASRQQLWRPGDAPPSGVPVEPLEKLWRHGGTRRIPSDGPVWFAEVLLPAPCLIIVGASPIAVALCDLAARCGFRVWLVDPRRDFARAELFPSAVAVIHEWPEEGLAAAGMDAESFVAILAHDAKLDVPALAAALRAECAYIGLLGSPPTQEDRLAALRRDGFSDAGLRRIHGPIGLKELGGIEPEEIAVSILAEMIRVRRGRDPKKKAD